MRLGIDVGGTFTDLYAYDPKTNVEVVAKVPTSSDLKSGVFSVIEKAKIDIKQVEYFTHGSTICTNAIIQRTCPITSLIMTEGVQDLLVMGRYHRRHLYDPYQQRPEPLVKRRYIYGVPERINYAGEVIKELDKQKAKEVSRRIKELGTKSACVAFKNSYANPSHEEQMKDILKEDNPDLFVSLSSTIPKIREFKRFTTATARAMLWSVMAQYVKELEEELVKRGFEGKIWFVANNGGMIEAEFAIERPELMLLSGPAAGIAGALHTAENIERESILTMDMGGTSCDVSIIEGKELLMTTEFELDFDMPLNVPSVDIKTIGAGGGSIAWVDEGGSLRVGPQSAGAIPGPVCYGRGGEEATVTDANLLLGRLGVDSLLEGGIRLDVELARRAIGKIAQALSLDIMETARGIIRIVNENMAAAIRRVSIERGRDPRNFPLLTYGAAGPMHAASIAEIVGIPEVIIHSNAGVLSAFGCTAVDIKHDYERTFYSPVAKIDLEELNKAYTSLDNEGQKVLEKDRIPEQDIELTRKAMMRYIGQTYEVETPLSSGKVTREKLNQLVEDFHIAHKKEYGFLRRDAPVAIVDLRSTLTGKLGKAPLLAYEEGKKEPDYAIKERREVFFESTGPTKTPIYSGEKLNPGNIVEGPAVVEWRDFTAVIPPKRFAKMDKFRNMTIKI